MRKKVLYLCTKSNWGGAQRYVYDLASNLPKDRFETVVAAGPEGILFRTLQNAGIRTITIPGLQRDVNVYKEIQSLWHLVRLFNKERPDVIHLSSSKAAALGALAAKLSSLVVSHRSLVIFTVHGWGFNEDRPIFSRALIFIASWLTTFFSDRIILLNHTDYSSARRFIPKRKLTLIPNGIAPISFLARADARASLAQKINKAITPDHLLIGVIAELTKNKGLPFFLSAFHKFLKSDFRNYRSRTSEMAIIIGGGKDHETLLAMVQSLGLTDSICIPGFLPDAAKYLKGFDIFVLPSLKEGLPYTLMEAMAAGLPVIGTRVGGIPDLIIHRENGILVRPKDPDGLARAIAEFISNPHLQKQLGAKACVAINEKFSFSAMIQNTITLYEHP